MHRIILYMIGYIFIKLITIGKYPSNFDTGSNYTMDSDSISALGFIIIVAITIFLITYRVGM